MTKLPAKRALLMFQQAPHASADARERIDLALTLAASDWPLTVAFVGPGVLLLAPPPQGASSIRDVTAALASLELFGVERVFVDAQALIQYSLEQSRLRIAAQPCSPSQLTQLLKAQDCLL